MQNATYPSIRLQCRVLAALVLGAVLAAPTVSRALTSVGDNADLFILGNAMVTSTDNLFLLNSATPTAAHREDLYANVDPGLRLEYGRNSDWKGSLSGIEDLQFYSKNTNLDTNLTSLLGDASFDDSVTKVKFDGGWQQLNSPTATGIGQVGLQGASFLVLRDLYTANGSTEVELSEKTTGSAGVDFSDTFYHETHYDSSKSVSVPLNVYYKIDPKYDLSLGLGYRTDSLGSAGSDSDYFFNTGIRGEIVPKLTGTVEVGYNLYRQIGGSYTSFFGATGDVTYLYEDNLKLGLKFTSDSGFNAFGADYRTVSGEGTADFALDAQTTIGGAFGWAQYDYLTPSPGEAQAERDSNPTGSVYVRYIISTHVTASLTYNYLEDSSTHDQVGANTIKSYTANQFVLSVTSKF